MADQNKNVGDVLPPFNRTGVSNFENPVSQEGGLINKKYCEAVANFEKLPQTNGSAAYQYNTDFEILGTNASDGDVIFSTTVGGIELETDGATNDSVILLPHLGTNFSKWQVVKWGTENETEWEALVRTGASVAAITLWAGLKLTNTPVVATDDNQAFFRFDTADSNTTWQCITSRAGTDVTVDSGVTVAANTNYHLRVKFDADRKPHFYINNVEVVLSAAGSAAMTNDIDLIPYIGVLTVTGSAAKKINIIQTKIRRVIFESS